MGDTTTKKVEQLGGQAAWPKMRLDKFATFAALVVLLIVFSIVAKNFFTVRNLLTLALQTSTITLMGIGVTFIIITGGIDLSIGSAIALTGTIAVMAADAGLGIWQSMVIGLLTGAACGLLNGLLVTRLRLPPFIATLGTMMIYRGLVLTVTNANSKPAPDAFGILGNNTLFRMTQQTPDGRTLTMFPGISYIVIIMIICALIFHFILKKMRIGRYIYSIGSNEEASRLSGIKVKKVKVITYMIGGLLSGLTGILLASRMVTSQPNGGIGYELNAIAAAVIGGTSLMGGIGTVSGTVIGSFIIGVLSTGLTMMGANYFSQQIVIGVVVIGAVAVDQLRNRK
ncbi:MAG TPA: ABC transporter permease [Rectinemataceae bacterium]|nr:ABC transporter permease [Rectinemataceae bacterium]